MAAWGLAGLNNWEHYQGLNREFSPLFSFLEDSGVRFIPSVFSLGLLVVQSLLFNRLVGNFELFGRTTLIPGLAWAIAYLIFVDSPHISADQLAVTLILMATYLMLRVYREHNSLSTIFPIGLLIGLGALLFSPVIGILLGFIIALLLLKSFNWREVLWLLLAAALLPLLVAELHYVLYGVWPYFDNYSGLFEFQQFHIPPLYFPLPFYLFIFLSLAGAVLWLSRLSGTTMRERKQRNALFWIFFVLIILGGVTNYFLPVTAGYFFVPLTALLVAFLMVHSQVIWLVDVLIVMAIVIKLIQQLNF